MAIKRRSTSQASADPLVLPGTGASGLEVEFFENCPLYTKRHVDPDFHRDAFGRSPLSMYCEGCSTDRTFSPFFPGQQRSSGPHPMMGPSGMGMPGMGMQGMGVLYVDVLAGGLDPTQPASKSARAVFARWYRCAHCCVFSRTFLIAHDPKSSTIMKVGQDPMPTIALDPLLAQALGSDAAIYRKGRVCETQGYGIAAHAYYRRVVENLIAVLLVDLEALIPPPDKGRYAAALDEVKRTIVAADKIRLVKDLLPAALRPNGANPLAALHEVLSRGLHEMDDAACLDAAAEIRMVLEFLVRNVAEARRTTNEYTEAMKRLLDRKTSRLARRVPQTNGVGTSKQGRAGSRELTPPRPELA